MHEIALASKQINKRTSRTYLQGILWSFMYSASHAKWWMELQHVNIIQSRPDNDTINRDRDRMTFQLIELLNLLFWTEQFCLTLTDLYWLQCAVVELCGAEDQTLLQIQHKVNGYRFTANKIYNSGELLQIKIRLESTTAETQMDSD